MSASLAVCIGLWGPAAQVVAMQEAAVERPAIDESLTRAFRELRAAEVAGSAAAVGEVAAKWTDPPAQDPAQLVQQRAQLAHRAIEARSVATTAVALVAAEDTLVRERLAMARRIGRSEAGAARELVLECAEDLLLRRLVADGSDGALAVGMPTAEQLSAAAALVAQVDEALAQSVITPLLAPAADVATDGAVFRARLLAGLARALEADVRGFDANAGPVARTARERARAEAVAHLEVAARSELPIPKEIACVLALARARMAEPPRGADLAGRERRARLLASAATSDDAMRAFVARVEAWRTDLASDGGAKTAADRAFPTLRETGGAAVDAESAMSLIAALAECRARREGGEPLDRLAAPLERALRASMGDADLQKGIARLRRTAAAIAVRLDAATRAMVRDAAGVGDVGGSPEDGHGSDKTHAGARTTAVEAPVLEALVAISPQDARFLAERADALRAVAGDPLIAPWLAVPLARGLREQGRADHAAEVLVSLLDAAPEVEGARDAAEIAVALSRIGARVSAGGELALDRALEVAARRVPDREAGDAWTLERVDLALFPQHIAADADRAAEILQTVSTRVEMRSMREVRALEIEAARVFGGGTNAGRGGARREVAAPLHARRMADQAGALSEALAGGDPLLLSRVETLRAAATLASERPAESCVYATRALEGLLDARLDEGSAASWIAEETAARAIAVWIEAVQSRGDAIAPPAAVRTLIERHPAMADAAAATLEGAGELLERAVVEGDRTRAVRDTALRLQPIARLLAEAVPDEEAIGALAALVDLAAGDATAAEARMAVLVDRTTGSRRARWLLAECLRARADTAGDAEARARSFALFRELAPLAADPRDDIWWRAQLGQLEILAADPETAAGRAQDIRARLNRLAALDPSLGGKPMAGRVAALRTRLERATPADTTRGSRTP